VEPQLLPSNQPFSQLSADSLFILPDQPDFFAENTPQLSKQTWYSITPNSSLGLIATRIIGSGNAVIELWDGCDAPTPVETANDRSGRIETLLVDSLEIGTTYRVRVADAKTNLDLESRTRTTYVDLFKAEVLDISDSQIFTSDINYALFNPNQIRFKFTPLNESFDEFIAFRAYNPGNSYDLNSFGLEDTEYLVSVSYRLVPLAIIVPYGESFLYSPGMSGIIAEADIPPAFEVFPNPKRAGDSHVFIKPSESRSASTIGIRLMDYQGRVLSEMNGLEANSTHLLEIPQHLNTGVYLVQILEDSGQSHVLKLQL
jgi:hypothetical protein